MTEEERVTTPVMKFRTVFASKIPGLETVELPANTWTTIGVDGWEWDDGDRTWQISVVEVKFRPTVQLWDAVISAEQGRGTSEISDATDETMHGAVKKAADALGDSLTIREEWT